MKVVPIYLWPLTKEEVIWSSGKSRLITPAKEAAIRNQTPKRLLRGGGMKEERDQKTQKAVNLRDLSVGGP